MSARSAPIDWNEIFRRTISGETMASLAKEFGVNYNVLKDRARRENWAASRLHDSPQQKAQRQQLAALLQTDSADFINFASNTTRHAMAETLQKLALHFHNLPLAQIATTKKILAFTSLLKAAAVLFDWQPRGNLALHAHLHRSSSSGQLKPPPAYFELDALPTSPAAAPDPSPNPLTDQPDAEI